MGNTFITLGIIIIAFLGCTQQTQTDETISICRREAKATKDDMESFIRHEVPTTRTGNCLLACVFERTQLMKMGRYNLPGAMAIAANAFKNDTVKMNKAKQALRLCEKDVSQVVDKCDVAGRIAKCATRESEKLQI